MKKDQLTSGSLTRPAGIPGASNGCKGFSTGSETGPVEEVEEVKPVEEAVDWKTEINIETVETGTVEEVKPVDDEEPVDWKTEMDIPEKKCRIQEDYSDSDGSGWHWDEEEDFEVEEGEEDERDRLHGQCQAVVPAVQRSGMKRQRSPAKQEPSPRSRPFPWRVEQSSGASSSCANSNALQEIESSDDDNFDNVVVRTQVDLRDLRYTQRSCKKHFQCGKSIWETVEGLVQGTINLSAGFLRLSVFETIDKKWSNGVILRCKDNRRLYALKEYASVTGKQHVMINVNLFKLKAVREFRGFVRNSDRTDGHNLRLRRGSEPWHQKHAGRHSRK